MIVEALARLLVAEHKINPIKGNVLALGKQTIAVSLPKIKEIFCEQECSINPVVSVKNDTTTRMRTSDCLDDASFFQLFGDIHYDTMDVSSYENASIVHDLNEPIPPELEGKFDFIVDGGTFDHLFDLKMAFANIVKLLKPGGRIFQWNASSNYSNAGYLSFSADFFYDYYALNKFANCQTFFAQSYYMGAQNWYISQFMPSNSGQRPIELKQSYFYTMVIALATKGVNSTYNRMPIQLQYRDEALRQEYRKNIEQFDRLNTKLDIKSIGLRAAKVPLTYKLLHFFEPKSDPKVYLPIGWL